MSSVLYIFITCQARFDNCYIRILLMMLNLNCNDFIIIKGGNEEYYDKEKFILNLDCNDYYEGLPEKVVKTFQFINNNPNYFTKYKYVCKMDDDIVIKKLIEHQVIFDYCGSILRPVGSRRYHLGKCSKDSIFNTTEYTGEFVPWCNGGKGYIVSKEKLTFFKNVVDYRDEIYEDLFIAKILYKNNIFPKNIANISDYLYSEGHIR